MDFQLKEAQFKSEIEIITNRVKQGNCVLFLGPGTLKTKDGKILNTAFAESLADELRSDNIEFDEDSKGDMPYMIQKYIQGKNEKLGVENIKIVDLREKFQKFTKEADIDYTLYDILSTIPFSLVINTNYDISFSKKFSERHNTGNRKTQFSFYDFLSNDSDNKEQDSRRKIIKPDQRNLLVYNIFGVCDEDNINSMILTEIEFIRFIGRIHQPNTIIPVDISRHFDGNKHCLFFGFDFEQWHLKVVVKALLKGNSPDASIEKNPPLSRAIGLPDNCTAFFYYNEFKFSFIDLDLMNFITTIQAKCLAATVEHIKPVKPAQVVFISALNDDKDIQFRKKIFEQLKKLNDEKIITWWTEDMATGEDSYQNKLVDKIKDADILVALVSISFINEKKPELIRQGLPPDSKRKITKMAIKLRPCIESGIEELKDFIWHPESFDEANNRMSLSIYDENKQELIISFIAQSLAKKVYELNK